MSKCSTLLLLLVLIGSSLLMNGFVNASTTKPSVPEFTLRYADYSYTTPPTYGVDPYTGKNITLTQGYEVVNRTVLFTIKNQPFTPYMDFNGTKTGLYYHIRYKGSYENTWSGNYQELDGYTTIYDTLVFPASNTAYTDIFVVDFFDGGSDYQPLNYIPLPNEGSVDFQVQAIIGAASLETLKTTWSDVGPFYRVTGEIGDWSSTQTITIGDDIFSIATPNPTASQSSHASGTSASPFTNQSDAQSAVTQSNLDWAEISIFVIVCTVVGILLVALFFTRRRINVLERKKNEI